MVLSIDYSESNIFATQNQQLMELNSNVIGARIGDENSSTL